MLRQRFLSVVVVVLAVTVLTLTGPAMAAEAGYSVGFKSNRIEITSPTTSGFDVHGVFHIEGKANLDRVWVALRGPGDEVETIPVEVRGGGFATDIWLRFGTGKYTVWAGDNAQKFSGKIRFELQNQNAEELRYTAPSAYVDSDHPEITALARALTKGAANDTAKAKAIHGWVTGNISYDYPAYLQGGGREMMKASDVLTMRQGVCQDYALLTAALARAAGIPARVVHGQARPNQSVGDEYHAWNEFHIEGRWVSLDTTWDAGYVQNGSFVRAPSDRYLIPTASEFRKTHSPTKYTTH